MQIQNVSFLLVYLDFVCLTTVNIQENTISQISPMERLPPGICMSSVWPCSRWVRAVCSGVKRHHSLSVGKWMLSKIAFCIALLWICTQVLHLLHVILSPVYPVSCIYSLLVYALIISCLLCLQQLPSVPIKISPGLVVWQELFWFLSLLLWPSKWAKNVFHLSEGVLPRVTAFVVYCGFNILPHASGVVYKNQGFVIFVNLHLLAGAPSFEEGLYIFWPTDHSVVYLLPLPAQRGTP